LFPREDNMDVTDLALSDVVIAEVTDSSSSLLGATSCKCAHADLTRSRLAIDGGNEEDFNNSAALTLFLSCLEPRAYAEFNCIQFSTLESLYNLAKSPGSQILIIEFFESISLNYKAT